MDEIQLRLAWSKPPPPPPLPQMASLDNASTFTSHNHVESTFESMVSKTLTRRLENSLQVVKRVPKGLKAPRDNEGMEGHMRIQALRAGGSKHICRE